MLLTMSRACWSIQRGDRFREGSKWIRYSLSDELCVSEEEVSGSHLEEILMTDSAICFSSSF